ncbi:hypothetical protein [Arthrobacter sp. 18067]|uniref:hypothetical protein n=1 Tax=Arthrobacter sp. 18067 TaxID=2681413 RepID=UPI001357E1A3|nr:hypothetical protein [Arthrobacter sp. 18067]
MNDSHESRSSETPNVLDLPRRAYFGAQDRAHLAGRTINGQGGPTDLQTIEAARRVALAETLRKRADDVVTGIRSLRSLDVTGHTEAGLSHLAETVRDMDLAFENLRADVERSLEKIRTRRDAVDSMREATKAELQAIELQAATPPITRREVDTALDSFAVVNRAPSPAIVAAAGRKGGRA